MEININLRVISQLNEGDKLLVSSNLLQIDRSNRGVINAVSRYFCNESRQHTIIRINELVRNALAEKDSNDSIQKNLIQSLNGLEQLKKTYIADPTVVAQLEVIIDEIKQNVDDIKQNVDEIKQNVKGDFISDVSE